MLFLYLMEEIPWTLTDEDIECLAEKHKEQVPIYNRWELLDIR